MLGYSDVRIMITQIVPNMIGPVLVIGTLGMGMQFSPRQHFPILVSVSVRQTQAGATCLLMRVS